MIGYFAQHQLEQLRPDESPLQHLARAEPATRELELRSYLGHFDFRGAMADAPVGAFSGGERSRLALALIVRRRPNLLLLDEPTNHLDLEMRHALTRALAEYEGSLVLVSHDRALLRTVCDGFLLVADGRADASSTATWTTTSPGSPRAAPRAGAAATPRRAAPGREERRAQRETAAAERQATPRAAAPAGQGSGAARAQIAALEAEKRRPRGDGSPTPRFYAAATPAEVQAASRRCAEVVRAARRGRGALARGAGRARGDRRALIRAARRPCRCARRLASDSNAAA